MKRVPLRSSCSLVPFLQDLPELIGSCSLIVHGHADRTKAMRQAARERRGVCPVLGYVHFTWVAQQVDAPGPPVVVIHRNELLPSHRQVDEKNGAVAQHRMCHRNMLGAHSTNPSVLPPCARVVQSAYAGW